MNQTKSNDFLLKDFKTLHVYQKAVDLEMEIDELIKTFPPIERYRLEDQLVRAVTSIGANIAESNGLPYINRERYHLGVAFGSSNEVRHWIGRANRKGYINEVTCVRLEEKVQEIRRILAGMFKRLEGLKVE